MKVVFSLLLCTWHQTCSEVVQGLSPNCPTFIDDRGVVWTSGASPSLVVDADVTTSIAVVSFIVGAVVSRRSQSGENQVQFALNV